jgi:hypothetical protein
MIETLILLVVYIVILGLVMWLLIYVVDMLPLPAPFGQVAKVVIMVVGVLILILLLLQLVGGIRPLRLGCDSFPAIG